MPCEASASSAPLYCLIDTLLPLGLSVCSPSSLGHVCTQPRQINLPGSLFPEAHQPAVLVTCIHPEPWRDVSAHLFCTHTKTATSSSSVALCLLKQNTRSSQPSGSYPMLNFHFKFQIGSRTKKALLALFPLHKTPTSLPSNPINSILL